MSREALRAKIYHKRSIILLLSTTFLATAMMITRIIFAIKANEAIADADSACGENNATTPAPKHDSTYDDHMAIASATLFAANTLFAMIFRTYNSLNRWWFANSLTEQDIYILKRYIADKRTVLNDMLVVGNLQIKKQLEPYHSIIKLANEVSITDEAGYAIGLSQAEVPPFTTVITKTAGDYCTQALALLPLVATNLLRLFYAFYAYNQIKAFRGVGYALAVIQAPLQFLFRSADTALLAIKIKDQAYANPKLAIFKLIIAAALTYIAMPYGLFFSQTLLSGTEQFFNHHLHNHDACRLQAGQNVFLWMAALTFAFPALEYLYYFLSQPLSHLRQWTKELGPLSTFSLFAVGAADAFYSAYYYPKDLVDAHMPQANSAFKLILVALYAVIYSLYYIPGNIESSSQIHKQLASANGKTNFFLRCCDGNSASGDNESRERLLSRLG